jgi:putative NADH-flavin reductase
MKIAVIGAGGWLGGTIAREALSRGIEVTAIGGTPPSSSRSRAPSR